MNSALKPVLSTSGPQNPAGSAQINKPMHPQGTPTTYGQPPSHMQPSLVNLPHNQNTAHAHPNSTPNHYSLNVPSAPQHYVNATQPPVPLSSHPAAAASQPAPQIYNPPKNVTYSTGYQPNLGHTTNQNTLPPVSQTLPPTTAAPTPNSAEPAKPQSNGTTEQQASYAPAKEKPSTPVTVDKSPEKPKPPQVEQKPTPEPAKAVEETIVPTAAAEPTVATAKTPEKVEAEEKASPATEKTPEKQEVVIEEKKEPEVTEVPQASGSPKAKEAVKTPSPVKVSTPRQITPRKSKTPKLDGDATPKSAKGQQTVQKSPSTGKVKRQRTRTQPYQSPLPELEIISKISSSAPKNKNNDEKLIVFYKNEFLAVRNSEGSFYVCQAVQNIYKSTLKIKIRWLSQDKNDKSGEIYTPDFYDTTDFDCILTNLDLNRVDKGKFRLPPEEKERTDSILKRSLAVEKGEVTSPSLTEEHPDGLDLSLYTEESQINTKKGTKRRASSSMRAGRRGKNKKSPEQAKVRKTVTKATKTIRKPLALAKKTQPVAEVKKTVGATSRAGRAKKRSESSKSSPVMDQKKAKVLAKVARKTAVPNKTAKSAKVVKPTATTSKVAKQVATTAASKTVATRKAKRATRK